jgi:hypothetical protein
MSLLVEKLNPVDPFEIQLPIFNNSFCKNKNVDIDDLHQRFYCSWLRWVYDAELESSIIYPIIAERIRNSITDTFLDSIEHKQKQILCNYLDQMGHEEGEHFTHFGNLLSDTYREKVRDVISDEYVEKQKISLNIKGNSTNPFLLLLLYYSGECYFWAAYYLFYKNTKNKSLQKIIQKLLVEEAQHNNRIYKIFKNYKNLIAFDSDEYINTCNQYRYLNLCFTLDEFDINKSIPDKIIVNNIYYNDFQKNFNQLVIKKWHQLYAIFHPEVDLDTFTSLINH